MDIKALHQVEKHYGFAGLVGGGNTIHFRCAIVLHVFVFP